MSDHLDKDEQFAADAVRKAFRMDAGLPADRTRRLYLRLTKHADRASFARTETMAVGFVVLATAAAVIIGGIGVYAALPDPIPEPTVVDRFEAKYANELARPSNNAPTAIPALALRAINPAGEVLHFTSVSDTAFGPDAGKATEEMWYDPTSRSGRLVRLRGDGKQLFEKTTIVSDGSGAIVTTEEPGEAPVTERVALTGRLGKSFDKLDAYRQMLESGAATVTSRGSVDGVDTYRLRAEIDGFGDGELVMVMEAEIRAEDYLPVSCRSGFEKSDGEFLQLRTRTFSRFETVRIDALPGDWFMLPGETSGSAVPSTPAVVDM